MPTRARATIVCLRSGKVLLVKKRHAKWNLPGGAIEAGETPLQAALRELEEETRLQAEKMLQLCEIAIGDTLHYIFCLQVDDQTKAIPAREISQCRWVRKKSLNGIPLTLRAGKLVRRELPVLIP